MTSARLAAERLFLPVGILLAWEVSARTGVAATYLSSPTEIFAAVVELLRSGEMLEAMGASVLRAYSGFLIGGTLGTCIGLLSGLNRHVRNFFEPIVSAVYPVPKISFYAVVLMIFGLSHGTQIALVSLSVFFPVFIAARLSVLSVNRIFVWAGQNMGAGPTTVFFRVVMPAAAPQLFAGLRVGLALSFVVLFAGELLGARTGLGRLINEGQEALRFDIMFAAILGFAILGFVSDRVLLAMRRRALRGQAIGTEERAF